MNRFCRAVKSLSHFSFDCHKRHFVNEMGLKKQTKLMAGAVPTIQPETKPTVASEARKRAGKSEQQNVASSVFGQKATDKQNCS